MAAATWAALKGAAVQPLDLAACPWLGYGCRFLRLDHRTLLANSPPADVLVRLRTGKSDDLEKDLAHVEGLFLRGRTLRFSDLSVSRLYAADVVEADLRGAVLTDARLQGADLQRAKLQGAYLWSAKLQGATLAWAQLQDAKLVFAQLQGANVMAAKLQGADLAFAQLQGTNLAGAELPAVNLGDAKLQCANLVGARLQGGFLAGAQPQGADLRHAKLQGAELRHAKLQGADLREAKFWETPTTYSNLGLVDLRAASWQPVDENERAQLRVNAPSVREDRQRDSKARLERVVAPGEQWDDLPDFELDGVR